MSDPETGPSSPNYPERLRITVTTGDAAFDEAIAQASAADSSGGSCEEALRAFDSLAAVRELLTDRRLEVLRSVHEESPESISALARRLDRPYAVVHDDVGTLASHGLLHFSDGPRGAKRPFVPYESIRVDVPLVGDLEPPDVELPI